MAIVLFVSDQYTDGYGDFLFGLKMVDSLRKRLAEQYGYTGEIYLVSGKEGKSKIVNLAGDVEFKVNVLSRDELLELHRKQKITIDYFIEAPVFDIGIDHTRYLPQDTPVLVIPEYSYSFDYKYIEQLKQHSKHVQYLDSGFQKKPRYLKSDKLESGIILSSELQQAAILKQQGDKSVITQAWKQLGAKISSAILQGAKQDDYASKTDISFEYSNNMSSIQTQSSCYHFLQVLQAYKSSSTKNQDVFTVGNEKDKKRALNWALPSLISQGYGKVSYVDVETGEEIVLHDDHAAHQKTFRMLMAKKIEHSKMMAMQIISDDLCGATGDQSFGEAFSANKFIVYETRSHKKAFAKGYLDAIKDQKKSAVAIFVQSIGAKFDKSSAKWYLPDGTIRSSGWIVRLANKAHELAELMIYANSSSSYSKLQSLFADPEAADFLAVLKIMNQQLAQKFNLTTNVMTYLDKHQASYLLSLCQNTKDNLFRVAILTQNLPLITHLLSDGNIDLSHKNDDGVNLWLLAMQQQQWDVVEEMVKVSLSSHPEYLSSIIEPNAIGKSAIDFITPEVKLDHPNLFNLLQLAYLKQALTEVTTYEPSVGSKFDKRVEQINLLEQLKKIPISFDGAEQNSVMAIIGALLLIRKSIQKESRFIHNSKLLAKIELELKKLNIHPRDDELKQKAYSALKVYAESHPEIMNQTLTHDFPLYSGLVLEKNDPMKSVFSSPLDLSSEQLIKYQQLLDSQTTSNQLLKLSRKSPQLQRESLPFSVVKKPGDKGFYVLSNDEGNVLGGTSVRVRKGYYFDGYKLNPQPIVIKIEETKSKKIIREMSLFAKPSFGRSEYLLQSGTREGKQYSFFSQLPGEQLNQFVSSHWQDLTIQKKVEVAIAVLEALKDMHAQGIVHLNVRPENILYDANSKKAFLIDYGNAKKIGKEVEPSIALPYSTVSVAYTPPEYASKHSIKADPKMDVYSATATLALIFGLFLPELLLKKFHTAYAEVPSAPLEDPEGNYLIMQDEKFVRKFISEPNYNFSILMNYDEEGKVKNILERMSSRDPATRLSVDEAIESFKQVLELTQRPSI